MNLVIWPQRPEWVTPVRHAAGNANVVTPASEAEALAVAAEAEGWIGRLSPALLAAAPKLRWLQSPTISLEHVVFPELVASSVTLTNMRHLADVEVSTHALTLFLAMCRDLPKLFRQQQDAVWKRGEKVRDIPSMTVLILGVGAIGSLLARQIAVLGAKIIGVDPMLKEPPAGVTELDTPDRLPELLPNVDAVIVCAPLTPSTMGLFDEAMFRRMRPDALFVNVGRGQIVQTAALERALREGWIERAAIDVAYPEPLPPESPLWKFDNLIITPHLAGVGGPRIEARMLECVLENVRRFVAGRPLATVADKAQWF